MNTKYGSYDVGKPRYLKTEKDSACAGCLFVIIIIGLIIWQLFKPKTVPVIISPCQETGCEAPVEITLTPTPEAMKPRSDVQRPIMGNASWYSVDGCIGCSADRTMANGQRLDDTRNTIAYNYAPLNSQVTIRNTKTGATVVATITDRGGFERHGKIADLTIATRDALGCGDTCPIELVW